MGRIYIDGAWQDGRATETRDVINPFDASVLEAVAECDEADVEAAVAAARRAFDDGPWPQTEPADRGRLLLDVADGLQAAREEIAHIETRDTGKTLAESRQDVDDVTDVFRYYGGLADKLGGERIATGPDVVSVVEREPVGVCGQIIPWNYPLQMAAWKVAPALACGNTVVLKPAEQTPLTALELAAAAAEAGLPAGVLNVLPGYGETERVRRQLILDAAKSATRPKPASEVVLAYAVRNRRGQIVEEYGMIASAFAQANMREGVGPDGIGLLYADGSIDWGAPILRDILVHALDEEFVAAYWNRHSNIESAPPSRLNRRVGRKRRPRGQRRIRARSRP
jgi:hypothetical protein